MDSEPNHSFMDNPSLSLSTFGTLIDDIHDSLSADNITSFFAIPHFLKLFVGKSKYWIYPFNAHTLLLSPDECYEDKTPKDSEEYAKQMDGVNTNRKSVVCTILFSLLLRFCSFDLFLFLVFSFALLVLYLVADHPNLSTPNYFTFFDDSTSMLSSISFKTDPQLFHHANDTQFTLPDNYESTSESKSVRSFKDDPLLFHQTILPDDYPSSIANRRLSLKAINSIISPAPRSLPANAQRNREAFV
ncbi:hypothetical protein DSO57_1010632 [Entomophthora muscae]|uniref:Uncharacterized protein n=1 Tax=Entomophthora muscae TaxID=34485 RepID=A0ACC2S8B2_9FUNG|nr:hypothetical protein DSO57_1010632 [Entomophthora muscae]